MRSRWGRCCSSCSTRWTAWPTTWTSSLSLAATAPLEPALVARPGRIDQAIEFPLPDDEGRRRLFGLYGRGLNLRAEDLDDMVRRTAGASPAFIRELLRKAALLSAEESTGSPEPPSVTDEHLRRALRAIV